jgi:anti-sigma regulatory factor (Ser/Thr protein kinase)
VHVNTFNHEALLYGDDEEFLAATMPPVTRALDRDDAVLAALSPRGIDLLRSELGPEAAAISFADIQEVGRNPARIIPIWRDFADANAGPGRRPLGIGEPIWAGRTAEELVECHLHESLLNNAFDDGPVWDLLCPYDTASLDPEVIAGARCSHPRVAEEGAVRQSEAFRPLAIDRVFAGELDEPPARARRLTVTPHNLSEVRRAVSDLGASVGLDDGRIADLMLAVTELASNSVRHGGGEGLLLAWEANGAVLCEMRDTGCFRDPLVGRRRAHFSDPGGRGLYLVNSVSDLVQIRSGEGGSRVRIQVSPAPERAAVH